MKDISLTFVNIMVRGAAFWRLALVAFSFLSLHPANAQDLLPSSHPAAEEDTVLRQDIPSVENASKYKQPVYTASKDAQQITEAPSSITVITADEIEILSI